MLQALLTCKHLTSYIPMIEEIAMSMTFKFDNVFVLGPIPGRV